MKKIFTILIFFPLISLLNGCVNLEQKTVINENGSGSMNIYYYTDMSNLDFGDEIAGFGFNEELVRENFRSDNISIRNINIYETLSDSVKHVKISIDFKDINLLPDSKAFGDIRIDYNVTPDKIDFSYTIPMDTSTAYNFESVKSRLDYEFELPAREVICTNGKVSGNKIIFNRRASDLYNDIELFAKIRKR